MYDWLHYFCGEWEGWALINWLNHTSWVTAVTPTDRPKSVRNSCVIKVFGGVFMLSRCFLDCSVGVGVFVTGLSQISSFFYLQYQHCFTNNCRISNKGPPQSYIHYFVVPDQISNISYSRISGNKWHVKFPLSFIILQQYTRLSITKWRSSQFQLGICFWNTDAPAATESKYGKHFQVNIKNI